MATKRFLKSDYDIVCGMSFEEASAFIVDFEKRLKPSSLEDWQVDGFRVRNVSQSHEDARTVQRGFGSDLRVTRKVGLYGRPRSFSIPRWTVIVDYHNAKSDDYQIEYEFKLHDRHDNFVGTESCRLSIAEIIIDIPPDGANELVDFERVCAEIHILRDQFSAVQKDTATPQSWFNSGRGLTIQCRECQHSRNFGHHQIPTAFNDSLSIDSFEKKLLCTNCNSKGRIRTFPTIGNMTINHLPL